MSKGFQSLPFQAVKEPLRGTEGRFGMFRRVDENRFQPGLRRRRFCGKPAQHGRGRAQTGGCPQPDPKIELGQQPCQQQPGHLANAIKSLQPANALIPFRLRMGLHHEEVGNRGGAGGPETLR